VYRFPISLQDSLYQTLLLQPEDWQVRQANHRLRVGAWIDAQHRRSVRREKHPVYDFLFTYYSFRPSWLRRWHPGPGFVLAGGQADDFLRWKEYRRTECGVTLDASTLRESRRDSVAHIRKLLAITQSRPAFYGCFGLHEWAMVYRQSLSEIRHNGHPLRFSPEEITAIVEENPVCCTHYDAFRFFSTAARPLNRHPLTRDSILAHEQRGCLHANMDLYKWAFKLSPFAPSELVADCFELARGVREVDMRASPYDLRSLGFLPIPVETAEGRAEYEQQQREFARLAEPLRQRIIVVCDWILSSTAVPAAVSSQFPDGDCPPHQPRRYGTSRHK
jgi:hypothetical protein